VEDSSVREAEPEGALVARVVVQPVALQVPVERAAQADPWLLS
jgi:hypothetical protein